MRFTDRRDAGRRLAARLGHHCGEDAVVLGLPRGGVPVAAEVAAVLDATLDVVLVRKLGVPGQEEWAMGAAGEGGVVVLNEDVLTAADVSTAELAAVLRRERDELDRRRAAYRRHTPPSPLTGRTVIVVDDGIATGATAQAALEVVAAHRPGRLVFATPVAPHDALDRFGALVDELVVETAPSKLRSVGAWYEDFAPVSDDEVVAALRHDRPRPTRPR